MRLSESASYGASSNCTTLLVVAVRMIGSFILWRARGMLAYPKAVGRYGAH